MLWILILLPFQVTSIYFSILAGESKCFQSNVYKNQRLLIEIQTQILDPGLKLIISVSNGTNKLLDQQLQSLSSKYTVPKQGKIITDQIQSQNIQYLTCLSIVSAEHSKSQSMVSLILSTNFDHIIKKKQSQNSTVGSSNLDRIDAFALKITDLSQEQIEFHQNFEIKQHEADSYIIQMKDRIHFYFILQCLIMLVSSGFQIYLLNHYLRQSCLI